MPALINASGSNPRSIKLIEVAVSSEAFAVCACVVALMSVYLIFCLKSVCAQHLNL
jgi:hypothetical protein